VTFPGNVDGEEIEVFSLTAEHSRKLQWHSASTMDVFGYDSTVLSCC
jgi:hypothetical protein